MNKNPLDIVEIFASIQGETSFTGLPTTFVRLARCNLRCTWCDTPYSFGRGKEMALEDIVSQVQEHGLPHVCITGGEPLLQAPVHELMKKLCDLGFRLSIETGGSLPIHNIDPRVHVILDIKCPASGMSDKNFIPNLEKICRKDQVKFVVENHDDYQFAKSICEDHELFSRVGEVLLSPVHGKLDSQRLVRWIVEDRLPVRLNLQIHKFIWHPETQGV